MPPRYRCAACGNLTRFDVVATRRTRSFHHYTIGGALSIEDEEVLSEEIEQVTCRWCSSSKAVEVIDSAEIEAGITSATADPAPAEVS
jgi:hypothetical protein